MPISVGELDHVCEAGRIEDIGTRAAISHMRPGMTELDVYAGVIYAMARAGESWHSHPRALGGTQPDVSAIEDGLLGRVEVDLGSDKINRPSSESALLALRL